MPIKKRFFTKNKQKIYHSVQDRRLVGNKSGNVREKEIPDTLQPAKVPRKHLFPNNTGIITEIIQKLAQKGWAFWLTSVGGAMILILSFVFFIVLVREALFAAHVFSERLELKREMLLWENIAARYPGYRDADFQVAVLAYRLGERQKSREFIEKTLIIDPNFEPARQLLKIE